MRLAAGGREEELERVKPQAEDSSSSLFFDQNMDGWYNQGDEETFDETTFEHGIRVTPLLTVWRKLHVEVDSMGAVVGNIVPNTAIDVQPSGDEAEVLLGTWMLSEDENRFVPGTLRDDASNSFEIVYNSAATVIVRCHEDGTMPLEGDIELEDDDHLQDGQDVPMPDYSELKDAMAECYIESMESEDDDEVMFLKNAELLTGAALILTNWDSLDDNSEAYWVAYLVGAFQGVAELDNDPVTEGYDPGTGEPPETPEVLGETWDPIGGSLIYLETIKDCARQFPGDPRYDPTVLERDNVVHEVGHAVADRGDEAGVDVTRWPDEPARYSEEFQYSIRTNDKPRAQRIV